jgi:DNA-binding response OmpR family regulator
MLTGFSSVDSAVFAMRNGALNYLEKPASKEEILQSVEDGLARARRERQRNAFLLKARQMLESGLQQLDEIMPGQTDLLAEAENGHQNADPDRFLQKGPLTIDTYRRKATLNGELLDLTAGEYDLLYSLAKYAPQVLNPQELVQETRGFECSLSEARELIRWQVYLLRQKVELDPAAPQYILNVRGRGYMWAAA